MTHLPESSTDLSSNYFKVSSVAKHKVPCTLVHTTFSVVGHWAENLLCTV